MKLPYYRRNLYVLGLAVFLAGVSWTQVVPFLPLYLRELGTPDERLAGASGLVFSMHFLSAIVMMPVWGKLADRVGRKPMTVRAGLFLSAIYLGLGLSAHAWHVAVLRFLNGALTGFIPSATALVAANTPREFSGRYVAWMQSAVAAGSVIGPGIGGAFASALGVRGAMILSAGFVLFSTLLVAILVQERHFEPGEARSGFLADVSAAVRSPVLIRVMLLSALGTVANVAVQPILSVHLESMREASNHLFTGVVFALPGVATVLSATSWVRLAERWGYQRVSLTAALGAGGATALLYWMGSPFLFAVVFFVAGLFAAALRPLSGALTARGVEESFQGRAFGMMTSAGMLGGLCAPLITGAAGTYWGTGAAFLTSGAVIWAGALFLLRWRETDGLAFAEGAGVQAGASGAAASGAAPASKRRASR